MFIIYIIFKSISNVRQNSRPSSAIISHSDITSISIVVVRFGAKPTSMGRIYALNSSTFYMLHKWHGHDPNDWKIDVRHRLWWNTLIFNINIQFGFPFVSRFFPLFRISVTYMGIEYICIFIHKHMSTISNIK